MEYEFDTTNNEDFEEAEADIETEEEQSDEDYETVSEAVDDFLFGE